MRGTSGSGKSTIFRKVLDGYHRLPQFTPGRRQPFYYFFTNPAGHPDVMVLGHYETPCGGCDTIGKQHTIFEPVRLGHKLGKHVLFEGLLVSGEVVNTVQLHKDGLPLQVIALTTPVDLCIDSVNERRRRKNPDKAPVDPKNTVAKARNVEGAMGRLKAAGVSTLKLDRDGAEEHVAEILKRPPVVNRLLWSRRAGPERIITSGAVGRRFYPQTGLSEPARAGEAITSGSVSSRTPAAKYLTQLFRRRLVAGPITRGFEKSASSSMTAVGFAVAPLKASSRWRGRVGLERCRPTQYRIPCPNEYQVGWVSEA